MGLIIGVGDNKPSFPYDYYYGVKINTTVADPALERVGRAELHVSLPVQSKMRRCLLNDSGEVVYYLHPTDSSKRDTGAAADLTGASGMVMVEIPEHYRKFEFDGTYLLVLLSEYALPGFHKVRKVYRSAYEATVERSTLKLCSVVNTDADYRGGNNNSGYDGTYRDFLGRPATQISLTNFRTYARKRGTAGYGGLGWNCDLYEAQLNTYWLYVVEYANLNCQAAFTSELTSEGYRQGGLGSGVTTLDGTKWKNFNGYYPFVPCGYTNSLGNTTGNVEFTMPFEYNSNGAGNYAGEYDAETAYAKGKYVSSGDDLYYCKAAAEAGTAITNTSYFTKQTRTVVNVPSYRGLENPFGHIWSWTDGLHVRIVSGDDGVSEFYRAIDDDPANFQDSNYTGYEKRGEVPRTEGYVKAILFGEYGENIPQAVGGSSTTYFCDYFYTVMPSSGEQLRGVYFGGRADNGAKAGLSSAATYFVPTNASADIGSRLCFIPAA